jgi:hypothetical protein
MDDARRLFSDHKVRAEVDAPDDGDDAALCD